MLSKSLVLVAAFAAFVPAFASPAVHVAARHAEAANLPSESLVNFERSLIGVGVVVDNILNNATVSILSTRDTFGCTAAEVNSIVRRVASDADTESLSVRSPCNVPAVRAEASNVLEEMYMRSLSTPSKRSEGCDVSDVYDAVYRVANAMGIPVYSKRGGCDTSTLNSDVKNALTVLDATELSNSKREEFSLSSFIENL